MRPKIPPTKHIEAFGFADAWQKLIKTCMNEGALKRRFYGTPVNTYDIVSLTEIKKPFMEPMLHPDFPTKELHMKEYEKQFERDYDWRKQGFEYSYMDRLVRYPKVYLPFIPNDTYYSKSDYESSNITDGGKIEFIDQLKVIREKIHDRIEKGGECLVSNRDEAITWIPDRDLFVNEDQPCLQRVWFQIYEHPKESEDLYETKDYSGESDWDREIIKGKGEFHVMWRSRDLYGAWNSNLVAITKMLNREIFEPNNIDIVRVVDFCNSNHIYEVDWEAAKRIKPIAVNPQLMR